LEDGVRLSYTDGQGTLGAGHLTEDVLVRGQEEPLEPLAELELAVAPPHERDRVRWLVEKAAELEVTRIRWLRTDRGNARPKVLVRAREWAVAALEQSRGAYLTEVDTTLTEISDLDKRLETVLADPSGARPSQSLPLRVMIGPEGGWAPGEIAVGYPVVSLGRSVLRTETAAVVAAALFRETRSM
jgi:16S rRNA (uracil1498-N3)-methyltransferase